MSKTVQEADIVIIGAGLAGLLAMLRFAHSGYRVIGIERGKMPNANAPREDLRSTALLMPSIEMTRELGLWPRLSEIATPLEAMQIVDISKKTERSVLFENTVAPGVPFGYNFPNQALYMTMLKAAKAAPNLTIYFEDSVKELIERTTDVSISTENGRYIRAKLLVAADGRQSAIRNRLNIPAKTIDYQQSAIVFSATHERPHENISTEIHEDGGPFTFVPIQDVDGKPASAIVWMDDTKTQRERMNTSPEEFATLATARSNRFLGDLTLVGARALWPIISLKADRIVHHRIVLIAEAAHVVPPIGAQGLNISVQDIDILNKYIKNGALDNPSILEKYEAQRHRDTTMRIRGIDLLNRVSQADMNWLKSLRHFGLSALNQDSPLRRTLVKTGIGGNSASLRR